MGKARKDEGLPLLQKGDVAIAIGYQINTQSNSLLCQHYCGWCIFCELEHVTEAVSNSSPTRPKVGLVFINSAISEAEQGALICKLRQLKINAPVWALGGIVALESLLRRLFWPLVSIGKKGPLPRPVFVRPEPKAELIPAVPPSVSAAAEPLTRVVFEDHIFPAIILEDRETGRLRLVVRASRQKVAEGLGMSTLDGLPEKEIAERVMDKLIAIHSLRLVKLRRQQRRRSSRRKTTVSKE